MNSGNRYLKTADEIFRKLYGKMPTDGYSKAEDSSRLAWSTSYIMMGMLAYYEYNSDTGLIDKLVTWVDNMLMTRDNVTGKVDQKRKRVLPAWSSTKITNRNYCWLVHNGMIGYPILWLCKIIRHDPSLKAKYGAKVNKYVQDMVLLVDAFKPDWRIHLDTKPPTGQYWHPYYGQYQPFNMQNALGRLLFLLYDLTEERRHLHIATRLSYFQLVNLRKNKHAYIWNYAPSGGHSEEMIEDISHGGIDVDFAWMSYARGVAFKEADMKCLIETLNVCTKSGGYSRRVDGKGGPNPKLSFHIGRWGHLAYIDEKVLENLFQYYDEKVKWKGSNIQCLITAGYMCQVLGAKYSVLLPERG